jgi:hypothetical protein
MSENNNKPENFVQWMNINFSKPYLIFVLWWIIINLDFVLILIGKTHIWSEINDKYNMFKTVLDINPKANTLNALWYFILYSIISPLVGTFITIVGISSIMNSFKILSNWVDDIFKHWNDNNVQKRLLKQENKIQDLKTHYKSNGKEFQEKIDSIKQCYLFLYKEDLYNHIEKIDLESYDKKYKEFINLIEKNFSSLKNLEITHFGVNNNPQNREKIYVNIVYNLEKFHKLLEGRHKKYNSKVEKLHNIRDLFNKNEKVIVESFLMNLRWRDRFYLMKTIFKKKKKNKNNEISA